MRMRTTHQSRWWTGPQARRAAGRCCVPSCSCGPAKGTGRWAGWVEDFILVQGTGTREGAHHPSLCWACCLGCLRDQITKSPQIDLLATAVTPPAPPCDCACTPVRQILALLGISRTSTPEECRAGSGRRHVHLLRTARHAPHPLLLRLQKARLQASAHAHAYIQHIHTTHARRTGQRPLALHKLRLARERIQQL